MKELDEIRARLEKATPGPWEVMDVNDPGEGVNFIDVYAESDGLETICRMPNPADYSMREWLQADAELIANAPTDLARLIDLLESAHNIMRDLIYPESCYFDHHGGCQAHGYLDLAPGELCPQQEAKNWLSYDAALTPTPAAPSGAGEPRGAGVAPEGVGAICGAQNGTQP